jgi:hypothetical protein
MTRSPQLDNVTVSVYCKNGKNYFHRDTVPNPYGDYGKTLTFWGAGDFNELIAIPLEQIEKIVYHLDDKSEK